MDNLPKLPAHIERYNEMPWWAQLLIRDQNVRRWYLPGSLTFLGVLAGLATMSLLPVLLGTIGTGAYLASALKKVGEKDGKPQFGLLEVLGMRLPVVLDEGLVIIIPFFSRIVFRSKEQVNQDLEFSGIRCRLKAIPSTSETFYGTLADALSTASAPNIESGGSVKVVIGITAERDWHDGWSVLDYDNAGETPQVVKILSDRTEEDLREIGRRLTWLQMTFATDLTAVHVISSLTGYKEFRGRPFFSNPDPDFIQTVLDEVKINGVSYIGGLGLNIRRLQVKSVIPEGKLAEAADIAAVEELRRVGMIENTRAIAEAFDIYRDKFTDRTMTDKDIATMVMINDKDARVEKKILEINASDLDKIGEALKHIFGKGMK